MIAIEKSTADPRFHRLVAEQRFDLPRDDVFRFFADATQLERITPPWLHFSIVSELPIEMGSGSLIDYRLRVRGVSLRWRTEITDWEPCHRFVDRQLRGPYRLWHHEHLFIEENGQTLVRDVVDYRVPLGFLMHPIFVRPELMKIFQYRHTVLADLLGSQPSATGSNILAS